MKTIFIDGQAAVTLTETEKLVNIMFLADDDGCPILEQSSLSSGRLQQLRNGSFDYTPSTPRKRANSTLLRKAAHGRLSATRDGATQLTLKSFRVEAIDWPRAFVRETVDMMTDIMGTKQMADLLSELLKGLKEGDYGV